MEESLSNHYKMWTREATTVLIQQYHANECMWMTTSPFYRNKQKRTEALINIAVIVSKLRPQTTAEDIKNKINGIRTQYVSEINKLILAANRAEPYEPTLWCFNMLTFLKPYTQPKQKCNGAWPRITTTKQIPYVPASSKILPRNPYESHPASSSTEQPTISKSLIKTEQTDDNEIEIIEEDDVLATDDDFSSHSSYHHEEKSEEDTSHSTQTQKEITITPPPQNGTDDHDYHEQRVKKLFSPKGFSSEITLLPKKIYPAVKRKTEDEIEIRIEKKKKPDQETPTSSKDEEMENRISIFGKFVISQMKLVTDKVLLLRLEHTIQNAIIDAQIKQIELDEANKVNDKNKTK